MQLTSLTLLCFELGRLATRYDTLIRRRPGCELGGDDGKAALRRGQAGRRNPKA